MEAKKIQDNSPHEIDSGEESRSKAANTNTHVVDILGNVKGRDQPIMLMDRALELVSMIDEEEFLNDNVVFFDPFCKAGEILLACALKACMVKRKKERHLFDIQEIQKELYESKRYYGLAPDERHHRLSLRTFLGNEQSHNQEYQKIIRNGNYLSEIDGKLNEKNFIKELENMIRFIKENSGKRIICPGNPPYSELDGGAQSSAKPIYNFFVKKLIENENIYGLTVVIPARWFSAGKNLVPFRKEIINSKTVSVIKYFENSKEIFPTVEITGGVCFLKCEKKYVDKTVFISSNKSFEIDISEYDIIPDTPQSHSIINKVFSIQNNKNMRNDPKFISDTAWSRKPFGLSTDYFKKKNQLSSKIIQNSIKCYTKDREIKYISIENIKKNNEKIDEWKVVVPKAYGAKRTLPKKNIFLIEKNTVCTETYNVIDSFKTKSEAEKLLIYMKTDFVRYLLGLRKVTQDIPKDRWKWVPYLDLSQDWTEEKIYKHFGITKEEQAHIKKKVEEWS